MPSDSKKKKAAAKKVAANSRGKKPATNGVEEEGGDIGVAINGSAVNGGAVNGNAASHSKDNSSTASTNGHAKSEERDSEFMGSDDEGEVSEMVRMAREVEHMSLTSENVAEHRAVTGVLASHPESRDAHFINFSITFHGAEILVDTKLELNKGRRYGLIGLNGCGKSTLLATLANREVPLPQHMDIFFLEREMPPSDKTALECVMEVDSERVLLEAEAERLAVMTDTSEEVHDRLMDIYERLDDMDADKAESRAGDLLFGLGFTPEMQAKKVKHFSGGWRMRIALARALFIKPSLLLLDEPTNHLDLEACVWLETELSTYSNCLVIVSHSQDFLNGVCTNIILMRSQVLKVFGGNYDSYVKVRSELDENQAKQYKWEQDQIAHMKNYIARFGHGSAKLARQAQSKEKTLAKMVQSGLTEKVSRDRTLSFCFPECGTLAPPVIMVQEVSFRYADDKPWIYRNLDFGVDLDTRVALVGPNGAGKSTLLKLIACELYPTEGQIRRHSHLRIGRYHQHLHEMLDVNQTSMDWMMSCFPAIKEREDMRKILGRYGLTGQQQTCAIRALSDGQRCRIIFAWLAQKSPHLLLLDEPTNHLDIETIDSLAEAIAEFDGGLLLVSHDFRLISQVAQEIWVCEHEKITKWKGDIFSYKETLTKKVLKRMAAASR